MMNLSGLKVAFIGAGFMAKEHIKAFASLDVELAGIYNRSKEKAQDLSNEFNIKYVASSIEDLYNKTKADIVVVAVYETVALEALKEISAFNWVVLAEKPIGLSIQDLKTVQQMGFKNEVFCATNRRCLSSTQSILQGLESTNATRFIRISDAQNTFFAKQIGHAEEVAERFMYANSIHLIDYFSYLCRGDVLSIEVPMKYKKNEECTVVATIKYSSGDEGLYIGLWNGKNGGWTLEVNSSEGRWKAEPLEKAFFIPKEKRAWEEIPQKEEDVNFKAGLILQAKEVLNYCKTGKKPIIPNIFELERTYNLIHSIFEV